MSRASYDCVHVAASFPVRRDGPSPMRFEIVVAPEPDHLSRAEAHALAPSSLGADGADGDPGAARPPSSATRRRLPAREVLDVFLDGANVTARIVDRQAACVLRD